MAIRQEALRSRRRVVELHYSESHLDRPPEYVFWAAAAAAGWNGQAVVDSGALTIAYTTPAQRRSPEYSVSIVCGDDEQGGTLLQVHASAAPEHKATEPFSLESDVAFERKISADIEAMIAREPQEWLRPIEVNSGPESATLRITATKARTAVFVNGVKVPLKKSRAAVEVQPGFFRVFGRSAGRSKIVDVMHASFTALPQLIGCVALQGTAAVPAELADVVAESGRILRDRVMASGTSAPPAPGPRVTPAPAGPGPAPAPSLGATAVTAAALLVVSYWAATEWLKVVDVRIDIRDIDDDNETRLRFCCCLYNRRETIYYPPVIGTLGQMWHYETFTRSAAVSVVRPSSAAPCPCVPVYMFGPITALSVHPGYPNLTVNLAGGPSTRLRVYPGVRCRPAGETAAFSDGCGTTFVPPRGG